MCQTVLDLCAEDRVRCQFGLFRPSPSRRSHAISLIREISPVNTVPAYLARDRGDVLPKPCRDRPQRVPYGEAVSDRDAVVNRQISGTDSRSSAVIADHACHTLFIDRAVVVFHDSPIGVDPRVAGFTDPSAPVPAGAFVDTHFDRGACGGSSCIDRFQEFAFRFGLSCPFQLFGRHQSRVDENASCH